MARKTCVDGDTAHHYIIDEKLRGKCKKCGTLKKFVEDPAPLKTHRKYWEISYETLRDAMLEQEDQDIPYLSE